MILCIDTGNTTIVFAVFKQDKLVDKTILFTKECTEDSFVNAFLKLTNIKDINGICYSSVVPDVDEIANKVFFKHFGGVNIVRVTPNIKLDLTINVDNSQEIGGDLLADLVGAYNKYQSPVLIIDLGTASKILLIDKNSIFSTCVIMPGIDICSHGLSRKAALLPNICLDNPSNLLQATNTIKAMTAGVLYGHLGMVKEICSRYERELGYTCKKVITGGASRYLIPHLPEDYIYDDNLVLEGLLDIYNDNSK